MSHTIVSLWLITRPKLLVNLLLLLLVGFSFALWDRALPLSEPAVVRLGVVMLSWSLLNAGTMWLNAHLDKDDGEVLFGEVINLSFPVVGLAYFALMGGVAVSILAGVGVFSASLAATVLSVLYSHPSTKWKGHPVGGPAVNLIGYAVLTPFVGWEVVGVSLNPRTVLAFVSLGLGVLSLYFVAQAFQEDDDRARGYRTYVTVYGFERTVAVARWLIRIMFLSGCALALIGWLPSALLTMAIFAVWVDRAFSAWMKTENQRGTAHPKEVVWRIKMVGWAAVVLAGLTYVHQSIDGRLVAGLGTAAGLPTDQVERIQAPAHLRTSLIPVDSRPLFAVKVK